MTAAQLIELLHTLYRPGREAERLALYRHLERYLIQADYDWEDKMNEPAEEGLIWSGVYLAWAQDLETGLHLWDTTGNRYLLPANFEWKWES